MNPSAVQAFIGKEVVLDTRGPLVFLGRLVAAEEGVITLEDADVHDSTQSHSNKEVYVLEARKHGIKKNRRRVLVDAAEVVSISLLEEVIKY